MIYFLVIIILYIFLIMPPFRKREVSGLYTHRGYYSKDQSIPENTLESFQKSIDLGYGIELDVQMSKDGVVYVFHDDTLTRLFGKDCNFYDLMSEEIDGLRLNGSIIPRFSDVLILVDGQVNLIVELKVKKDFREFCEQVVEHLDLYSGAFVVESFDPRIVAWFRFKKPDYTRGHIIMQAKEFDFPKVAHLWIHLFLNFIMRPDFMAVKKTLLPMGFNVSLFKFLGGKVVSWTIHEEDLDFKGIDAQIFEFYEA